MDRRSASLARLRAGKHNVSLSRRTVLLFTRAPEAEARHKRLPLAPGAQLFSGFLAGWRQAAADAGAELFVVTPDSSRARLESLLPGVAISAQEGLSFAAKLENAFASAFRRGAQAVLMVGGDCPPMAADDIRRALDHLESAEHALVLAPANDGGVNGIGFSAGAHRPLSKIQWCGENVFFELQAAAASLGVALLLMEPEWDLDSAGAVRLLYRLSLTESLWGKFRWLLYALQKQPAEVTTVVFPNHRECCRNTSGTRGPPAFCVC